MVKDKDMVRDRGKYRVNFKGMFIVKDMVKDKATVNH